MASYVFNNAKAAWFKARSNAAQAGGAAYANEVFPWNVQDSNPLFLAYRLVLICNGGAANGLDGVNAIDAATCSSAPLAIIANQFNGYSLAGEPIKPSHRSTGVDILNNHGVIRSTPIVLSNVGPGGPGMTSVTDLVLYWAAGNPFTTGIPNDAIPLIRYQLAAPIVPDGGTLTITFDPTAMGTASGGHGVVVFTQ